MLKIIKHQTSFILRQNMSLAVFFVLLSIVFLNFRSNVLAFQGSDIIEMYHPAKLLALSYDQVYNNMGYYAAFDSAISHPYRLSGWFYIAFREKKKN